MRNPKFQSQKWKATHWVVSPDGAAVAVMLVDGGVAYSEGEWETETAADLERLADDSWLFQGKPFVGRVVAIGERNHKSDFDRICGDCCGVDIFSTKPDDVRAQAKIFLASPDEIASALLGLREYQDEKIRELVAKFFDQFDADEGGNWADAIGVYLRERGVELHVRQPNGADPWEVVRLADGRTVYLSDESAAGFLRYRIE